MPARRPEADRRRLAELRAAGWGLRAAAREVGVAPSTAWIWQSEGRAEANRERARKWASEHREHVVSRQRAYRRRIAGKIGTGPSGAA